MDLLIKCAPVPGVENTISEWLPSVVWDSV